MKKAITVLLALFMVLSLVACGNQTSTDKSSTTNGQAESTTLDSDETEVPEGSTELDETEVSEESAEPDETKGTEESTETDEAEASEESTETDETETSTESEDKTFVFDTSWAGDTYVMPIPAPPVSDFKIDEIIGRSGGNAIQSSTMDVQDLTNDEVVAYRQTLESLGFVNNIYESDFDSRQGYEFSAKNENGDIVYINCNHNNGYFILIFEFAE